MSDSIYNEENPVPPLFNDTDFRSLFGNRLNLPGYKPRDLYPYERRSIKTLLWNHNLDKSIRNEFGQRPLTNQELQGVLAVCRNHKPSEVQLERVYSELVNDLHLQTIQYYQPISPTLIRNRVQPDIRKHTSYEEHVEQRSDAARAFSCRLDRYQETQDEIREIEHQESWPENHFQSNYQYDDRLNWIFGDIPLNKFWYYISVDKLDNTYRSNHLIPKYINKYTFPEGTYQNDSPYYQRKPTTYQQIITDLSPGITERESGRVFFHSEIRYNLGIRYDRQPSYVPNRTTIHNPNNKTKLLYKENPDGSILKRLSTKGVIAQTILHNILRHQDYIPPWLHYDHDEPYRYDRHRARSNERGYLHHAFTSNNPSRFALQVYSEIKTRNVLHDHHAWAHVLFQPIRPNFFRTLPIVNQDIGFRLDEPHRLQEPQSFLQYLDSRSIRSRHWFHQDLHSYYYHKFLVDQEYDHIQQSHYKYKRNCRIIERYYIAYKHRRFSTAYKSNPIYQTARITYNPTYIDNLRKIHKSNQVKIRKLLNINLRQIRDPDIYIGELEL